MRASGLVLIALLAACGTPSPGPAPASSTTPGGPSSATSRATVNRERDYLDALRIAGVPLSRTGETEIQMGHGVCAEVSKGADPESLADDLRRAVPAWTSDNVTAVIRTALALLC